MAVVRVLTESDLRTAVGMGSEELAAIEAVYPLISEAQGSMPPIMRVEVPESNGEIDIKTAYLPGYSGIAVKVSAGFFDNPSRGLPSLGGLMMVFDSETGIPESALFDNGYLTDLRTGLAGAVAAKHLAREDAGVAAVLGAGVQALMQLEALKMVRDIEQARVWARRSEQAEEFAARVGPLLRMDMTAVDSPGAAVDGVDVLVTTTPSTTPLVTADMLHPGLHITSVGSDAETKQELSVGAVRSADRIVCDSIAQSERLGELRAAVADGLDRSTAIELGQVISGHAEGRRSDDDVTICDLTGTGAQDTAIASLAVRRCSERGLGTEIQT